MAVEALYLGLLDTFKNKNKTEFELERDRVTKELAKIEKNEDFSYDDFIPYPSYENENFNEEIYNKKEFNRNKTTLENITDFEKISNDKCSDNSFSLTPNQKFLKGFLSPTTPYNGLLLFHGVGQGKTCTAISIAEQYHDIYHKKVLVILSSTLIENFRKQVFDIHKYDINRHFSNQCTGLKYPNMILEREKLDPETLEKKINKLINDRYQFMGYQQLANLMTNIREKIEENENDKTRIEKKYNERLSEIFSNRMVVMDEAHNIRNPTETGKKQISLAFMTLLKYVKGVKLVLLTATPMFNHAKEIIWTLNLLLTNDKRPAIKTSMVFDEKGILTEQGKNVLRKAARGYISYMRGENPFTFPFRLYPSINGDKNLVTKYPTKDIYGKKITKENQIKNLEIIGSQMSSMQQNVYDSYKKKVEFSDNSIESHDNEDIDNDEIDVEDEEINNELQVTLQISNIVYPAPEDLRKRYGSSGLESCFNITDNGKHSYKKDTLTKYGQFLQFDKISKYAPKIKNIIEKVVHSKGIVFVYSRYYSSGIIPLALALEHAGFQKYGRNTNIGRNLEVNDLFNGKKPKYIIISRRKDLSPNNDDEIAACKSANNTSGDIIKVVIVSKVGTEGIDFKRIREIHILDPWFNLNRAEQIIGRGVRYCSHIDLPKTLRNVTIFFHACLYNDEEESIDLRTYRLAEQKQKQIVAVEQVLKLSSIDCNLNKDVLVFPKDKLRTSFPIETSQGVIIKDYKVGDRDYSSICGYGKCEAKCDPDIKKPKIDDSTFDRKFIVDEIELYRYYISNIFKDIKFASYKKILEILKKDYKNIDEEILIFTLDDLITTKHILYDNKNRSGNLLYRGNKYVLHPLNIADTRMTFEDRSNETPYRKMLPLSELHSFLKKKKKVPIHEVNKNDIENKKNNGDIDVVDILDTILSRYNTRKTLVSKVISDINIATLESVIMDSIIDRLSKDEFEALMKELTNKKNNNTNINQILDSLVKSNVVILKDGRIKYYYNHFDGELYCYKNAFKKCSPRDMIEIGDEYNQIKEGLRAGLIATTKGYMHNNKGETHFKIRENIKSSGYVCHKTSSLALEELKNRIIGLGVKLGSLKLIKADLCYIYEIIMRKNVPEFFQRPYFIKIEKK